MLGLHMVLNKILHNRYLAGFWICLEFLGWHAIIIVIVIIEMLSRRKKMLNVYFWNKKWKNENVKTVI